MSEAKVIPFKVIEGGPVKKEINHETIACLEDLIADVKSGDVVAVGLVYVRPNHVVGTGWSSSTSLQTHLVVSGCASLTARLTRND